MHYIVARLKLTELLERDSHLTTARLVATQVILVETVEDLMVGEACHAHRRVGKSPVNGLVYRHEGYVTSTLLEDGLQALRLLGAVGEDIELVATSDEVGERLLHQLKVLMEERLRRGFEVHRCLHRSRCFGAKFDAAEGQRLADEIGCV